MFEFGPRVPAAASRGGEGESPEDITRLRGDIYLSRVLILRDAPLLAELREGMRDQKPHRLYQSARETERVPSQAWTA